MRVREAVEGDVEEIGALIRELADYENLTHEIEWDIDQLRTALFGPDAVTGVLIAETDDGAVAGFALWFPTFSTFLGRTGIWLEDLFVRPEHRGAGHGRALLAELRSMTDRPRRVGSARLEHYGGRLLRLARRSTGGWLDAISMAVSLEFSSKLPATSRRGVVRGVDHARRELRARPVGQRCRTRRRPSRWPTSTSWSRARCSSTAGCCSWAWCRSIATRGPRRGGRRRRVRRGVDVVVAAPLASRATADVTVAGYLCGHRSSDRGTVDRVRHADRSVVVGAIFGHRHRRLRARFARP